MMFRLSAGGICFLIPSRSIWSIAENKEASWTKDLLLMVQIRRSPVEVGSLSTNIFKVLYIPGGAGFLPSTVLRVDPLSGPSHDITNLTMGYTSGFSCFLL